MIKLSIISDYKEENDIVQSIKDITQQNMQYIELVYPNNRTQVNEDPIKNTTINRKFIEIEDIDENEYKNRSIKESKGEYILFVEKNSEISLSKILQIILEKDFEYEIIQSKIEYPNETKDIITNYSTNMNIYKYLFKRQFLNQEEIKFKKHPFSNIIFLSDSIYKAKNIQKIDERLLKYAKDEITFTSYEDIKNYLEAIQEHIKNLISLNSENPTVTTEYTDNLPQINVNNIPSVNEKELKELEKITSNIRTLSKDFKNQLNHYYISKYLRTLYDIIYNKNTDFNVLISVIIPAYNVEKYIDDCINSLLNQTFNNIEIICIDDCSTDNTYNILKFYEKKDTRVKCYKIGKKGGSGGCRNYGIKHARGKYIYYLDADDFLDLNALEEMYTVAEKEKTQILMFKALCYNDENNYYPEEYYLFNNYSHIKNKFFGIDDLNKNIFFGIPVVTWNKLFLVSFLKDINPHFPENLIHQDNPFFFETITQADRIYLLDEFL